jgi:hypothetical protein
LLILASPTAAQPVLATAGGTQRASTVAHQAQPQAAQPRSADVGWTFRDVDVQALLGKLKRFGVEAPVALEGRVTAQLSLAAPWRSLLRPGSYRIEGELSSPALRVAGVELQTISMHLLYTEGTLELTKLSFTVPGRQGANGTVSGTARLQLRPRGPLSAQLEIDRIPLATLLDTLPDLAGKASGTATGQFTGQVAAARVRDPAAWQGDGHLTLNHVQVLGLPPLAVATQVRLGKGQATLSRLTARFEGASMTASGNLALTAPYKFAARLQAAIPDLAWLNKLDADFRPPLAVAGTFALGADADGSLQSQGLHVRGTLGGQHLKTGPLTIDRLLVPYEGTLDRIRLNSARADLYGGRITANFSLPTEPKGNIGVGLRVRNVDLGALAETALEQRLPWRGLASGTLQLQAPAARITEIETWSGQGDLALERGDLFGIEVPRIAANVRVDKGELVVNRLAADSSLARVTGSAQMNLTTPFNFSTALRMENVDFAPLNRLDTIRLPVTVAGRAGISTRIEGTLQPVQLSMRGGVATRRLRAENVLFDTLDFKFMGESGDDPTKLASWRGQLDGTWGRIRVDQANVPGGSISVRLADEALDVSRLTSESGTMRINGSGDIKLLAPHDFALKLAADNVDVGLLNGLPLRPPVSVAGVASVSADVRGQLGPLKVEGGGKFAARNLRVAGAAIDSLSFDFAGDNASLALSGLALVAYRGRLDGKLVVPLSQASQGDVDVRWQRVDVGRALTDVRGFLSGAIERSEFSRLSEALAESRFQGWTWGSLAVQAPAGQLFDPAAWTGEVDVSLAAMRVFDWPVKKAFIRGRLAGGKAELTRLAFDVHDARLRGTASLELAEPYHFKSVVSIDGVNLADFNKLPEPIRPPVEELAGEVSLSLNASGTLQPPQITAKGSLTANRIEAAGATVDHLAVEFEADPRRLVLTRFHAGLYEGTIDGRARIALTADEAGRVNFNCDEVDLGRFVTDVAHLRIPLKGKLSGELAIETPAGRPGDVATWSVKVAFDTTPITAESASLGQFHGRLSYRRGMLEYGLDGTLLRGRVDLAGRWQPAADESATNEGHFELAAARLDALAALFSTGSTLGSLTGQINVNVRYRHEEKSGLPMGAGNLAIDDLRLDEVSLLDEVRGLVRVAADRIEIVNVQGLFADGTVTASAVAFLDPARRGSFQLDIDGAEMAQALGPWRSLASKVRGAFDAQLQGFFGGRQPLQVTGVVSVHRGSAHGLEYSGVRLPLAGTFDPTSGRGTVQLHGTSGQMALGRFAGDFDLTLAGGLDLKGHGKFHRIDLRTLLRQSQTARRMASGKVDGVYTVAGRNMHTVNDLTGTLKADLTDAQALSLPVLQQTLPYLTGGVSGSTTFDTGEFRAHLSRGVIHIDRFTLASGTAQIYAEGTVSLASRLDLSVLAKTGQLNARTQAIAMLAARVALVVSPPVGLLLEVTQFLSNQVINLDITGTVRSPTVRLQPLQLLGQEAARFFLYQALP